MWRLGTLQRRKSIPPSTVTPTRVFRRETTISKGANTLAMSLPRTPSGRRHHWREGGGDGDIDGLSARVNHSGTSANGTRRPRREAVCCWRAAAVEPSEGWSQTPRTRLRHPFSLLGGRVPESEAWSVGWSLKGGVCCCLMAFCPSPSPLPLPPPPPPAPTPSVQPLPLPSKENLAGLPRAEPGDVLRFKPFFLHTYARMVLRHVVLRLADQ